MAWGMPTVFLPPKSREEKIEEARRSGLIRDLKHLNGPNQLQMCCQRCGSTNVLVGMPLMSDQEKGAEIPYYCNACDYTGTRPARIKNISEDGVLEAELIPDGLIGITGSMVGGDY